MYRLIVGNVRVLIPIDAFASSMQDRSFLDRCVDRSFLDSIQRGKQSYTEKATEGPRKNWIACVKKLLSSKGGA
jgi:hypothetical protein